MAENRTYVELDDDFGCYIPYPADDVYSEIEFVYHEIFEERCYLQHGITLQEAPVVLDIGANVGLFSLMVRREHPDARIIAFEPLPPTYGCLRANLDKHGCETVETRNVGLGGKPESKVPFSFYPKLPANSTRYPEQKRRTHEISTGYLSEEMARHSERLFTAEEYEVDVERLSDVLAGVDGVSRIDLVKIDVEGAELDVLEGIDPADFDRIAQLVIEVQDFDGQLTRVTDLLGRAGYTFEVVAAELPTELRYHTVYARRV